MKTRVCLLLLAVALAGVAGYGIAHRFLCSPPQSELDRLQDVSHLARMLDLQPEQVASMKSLQSRLCGHLEDCCARHCVARKELAAALVAEPPNDIRVRDLLNSLSRCYAESERLAMQHIRSLREILDASQRIRFDRMITESLGGPCGVCTNCGAECGCHE